jgi:hypothetical protein
MNPELNNWLLTRPREIQELAERFPLESPLDVKGFSGKLLYVMGWKEGNTIIATPIKPTQLNYDEAFALRIYIHSEDIINATSPKSRIILLR